MGADEPDAITAVRLLDRGTREGEQRGGVGDDALLDGGFEPAGEGEAADREYRVAELQHARQMQRH